jgi:gamma-glutamylcyclotransferase (GGCT)/AIG2-like uncharacterized protein YtfP
MTTKAEDALRALALRTLEYVGIEPDPVHGDVLDSDAEMRSLALDALKMLGVDAAHELRRYLRRKKISTRRNA